MFYTTEIPNLFNFSAYLKSDLSEWKFFGSMNQPRYAHVAILVPKMAFFCEGQWFLNLLWLVPLIPEIPK